MDEGKIILYMFASLCILVGVGLIAGGTKIPTLLGAGVSFLVVGVSLILLVSYLPIQDIAQS